LGVGAGFLAAAMSELEHDPNKRFFEVLREHSEDKNDPTPEWEFGGMVLHGAKERCICGTKILLNYLITHKRTKKQLIIGSECIKRWINPKMTCEDCDAPLGQVLKRARTNDYLCRSCKKERKELEVRKQEEKQRQIKKMDNFMLYWYGKHRNHPFKMVAEDIPYTEYLLNIPEEKASESIKAFQKYASLVYEIKETVVEE
jgi:hypothetical protein